MRTAEDRDRGFIVSKNNLWSSDLIMLNPDITPQEDLRCAYFSWQIEQMELLHPEFRLELVDGQFLVGGTIEGSRWLLKEALKGWGLAAAIGFAPLESWWRALQGAYGVDCQTSEEWLIWAESLPLPDDRRERCLPLGSQYGGKHEWVCDQLRQALGMAVSQSNMGKCFGPRYGMWIGEQVFTPDIFMLTDVQLAENPCYDRFVRAAATLVVEVMLPEWTAIDEDVRWQYYQQHRVLHYWTVNPLTQQVRFWRWSIDDYEEQFVDADGGYRGLDGLTFTPELLWRDREDGYSRLPIVVSECRSRRWQLAEVETAASLGWGGMPLLPRVDLWPMAIRPEEFVAWCPECKLEGGPLIGGRSGTHSAIVMLLMSLGLVETVKLLPGYEWVRVLRRLGREQQGDEQRREHWWTVARQVAEQLQREDGIGGVGVIGELLQASPLHYWSEVQLILWDVPESVSGYRMCEVHGVSVRMTAVRWATPGEWALIQQRMTVLVGEWKGQESPQLERRLQFCWLEAESTDCLDQ